MRTLVWWPALALALIGFVTGVFFSGALVTGVRGFPVQVTDATGASVVVSAPPQRVISLAPSVTEILFALGADRDVVGVSDADDFPAERIAGKPRIGGVTLSYERIVALKPDLVIGMPSLQRDQLVRLRSLGVQVLAVEAESMAETIAQIRLLGRVTNRVTQAEDVVASMQRRIQVVQAVPNVRVYIEAWYEPVLAAATGTLVNDLAARAGAVNVFADRRGYVPVPVEAILSRNPDVILLTYPGMDGLLLRPGWRGLRAVRNHRVFEVPAELVNRPGPRIVEGLALISRVLSGRP